MRASADLVVVGAGVLGLSVAGAAAAAGALVLVLESGRRTGGLAGTASLALVSEQQTNHEGFQDLRRAAVARHADGPGFHPARVRGREAGAGSGWLDVAAYAADRAAAVEAAGGRVRTGAPVAGLLRDGVVDAAGHRHRAADVVVAAGAASAALLATAGPVPDVVGDGAGAWGFLVVADAPAHGLREVVVTGRLHVRPDGPDRLALQSLPLEAELARRGMVADEHTVWPRVRALASSAGFPLSRRAFRSVHAARRPTTLDGLPAVGRVGPRHHLVLAHSGVTLAPLLGDLVADEVAGRVHPSLDPFRPDRKPHHDPSAHHLEERSA